MKVSVLVFFLGHPINFVQRLGMTPWAIGVRWRLLDDQDGASTDIPLRVLIVGVDQGSDYGWQRRRGRNCTTGRGTVAYRDSDNRVASQNWEYDSPNLNLTRMSQTILETEQTRICWQIFWIAPPTLGDFHGHA